MIETWMKKAKCSNMDPAQFACDWMSPHPRHDKATDMEISKALCARCPVIEECARDALQGCAQWTVRAGIPLRSNKLTPEQRHELREIATEHRMMAHA